MKFCHVHGHGEFSLLDGVGTAEQRARRAAELGQPALVLSDHANLCGQMHHRRACLDEDKGVGIMPLHAVEAYFREQRTPHDKSNWEFFHMVLIAKDATGWRNLKLLTSEAYRSGFYRKPCVDLELVERYHEGLLASTSCFSGWVPRAILAGDSGEALRRARALQNIFGDDLYFEIQPHDFDDQRTINVGVVNLAAELGAPVVAANDQHYVKPEHYEAQDVKLMMQTSQTLASRQEKLDAEEKVYEFHAKTLYITSRGEMWDFFQCWHPDLPPSVYEEALDNTVDVVADRCTPFVVDTRDKLPVYFEQYPKDVADPFKLLRDWAFKGLDDMQKADDPAYIERLDYELEAFRRNHIVDFFLITADMCQEARRRQIAMGPSRGSAGGSLACRCVGITMLDPIAYGLKFERFLNPDRAGMPDIDLDFDPERVGELEEYLMNKYGRDKVVNLISFQRFGARRVLKDVGRVFDLDFAETNNVTKKIDNKLTDEKLEDIRPLVPELDRWAEAHPKAWAIATILQGEVAGFGEHPAGVVLGDVALDQRLPLLRKAKADEYMVTAWDEGADYPIISKLGFLKIDMLRIVELTKHRYALDIIERRYGERPDLTRLPPTSDPYDVDERVMENFRKGLTYGIWQFGGSPGITRLLRQVKPQNMLDLAAVNALYRPGPLGEGLHEEYVKRRAGEIEWQHWHPAVAPFLDSTFGILTYQEQIMDLVAALGGFSPIEADDVRRVISKEYRQKGGKARGRLEAMRERFINYAVNELGIREQLADEVFDFVGSFSGYSFNLSHASAYSLLSYQDMWLKTFYPDAFYAALLSYPPANPEKKAMLYERTIREARVLGVEVLPPDVNDSDAGFTVTAEGIRFGLEQIKGIGPASAAELIDKRPFASVDEITERTERAVTAGTVKALSKAGALDAFGARDHLSLDERADLEANLLNIPISTRDRIRGFAPFFEERVHTEDEVMAMPHGSAVVVGGELISGREKTTRGGKIYADLQIAFGANTWKCRLWAPVYKAAKPTLDLDEPILLRGFWDAAWSNIVIEEVVLARELYTPPEQAQAKLERDDAIARVESAADPAWREAALAAVKVTCTAMPEFISDDVWTVGKLASTVEDRALGPVMIQAARNGWCSKTDRVRPSVRSHLSGKPVWVSHLCQTNGKPRIRAEVFA